MKKLQYSAGAVPAVNLDKGRVESKFVQDKNNNYRLWSKKRSALPWQNPQRDRRQRLRRRFALGIATDGYKVRFERSLRKRYILSSLDG